MVVSVYISIGVSPPLGTSASKSFIRRFVITEKAPTRAFSWLKAATTAFTVGAFSVITNLRMQLFEALVDMLIILSKQKVGSGSVMMNHSYLSIHRDYTK